jgi:alpha-galactosidase/6-phospho-beta-glucosidase family protein
MVGEMRKIKYGSVQSMNMIAGKMMRVALPVQAAYWLKRNIESIAQACKDLDGERAELIKKYGTKESEYLKKLIAEMPEEKNEQGNKDLESYEKRIKELESNKGADEGYRIPNDSEEFINLWEALLNREIEVMINPINLKLLGDVKLTVSEVSVLDFMFVEDSMIVKPTNLVS